MNAKEHIDALFAGYEVSKELEDFKEEIAAHLADRARDLAAQGMSEAAAFDKAAGELGGITDIADEISRNKRNEVIQNMYVQPNVKVTTKHAIGYVVAAGIAIFGLLLAVSTFQAGSSGYMLNLGAAMPFITIPAAMFVFLGLTQETRAKYPMSWKRALWYALSTWLIVFSLLMAGIQVQNGLAMEFPGMAAMPFIIPGAGILLFLLLTEKKRYKPWVMQAQRAAAETGDPFFGSVKNAERFGIFTAALWTFAVALFLALGFAVGFGYAWLAFVFCVPVQLLLLAFSQNKVHSK